MEITLILGNGFDKNLGLKTSYKEFYGWYKNKPSGDKIVDKMKESIRCFVEGNNKGQEIINWGDAELALGEFSNSCKDKEEFILCYNDLEDKLADYIELQNRAVKDLIIDEGKVLESIQNIVRAFRIKGYEKIIIHTITLNYTDIDFNTFKNSNYAKIREKKIYFGNFVHLHGKIGSEITFGVGNISQIINQSIATELPDGFVDQIIKIQHDSLTQRNNYEAIDDILERSEAVYIYGWSFGNSDISLINKIYDFLCMNYRKAAFYNHGFVPKSLIRKSSEAKIYSESKREYILNMMCQFDNDAKTRNSIDRCLIVDCNNVFEPLKDIVL